MSVTESSDAAAKTPAADSVAVVADAPAALFAILAVATGALVANLYYAQPLIARIAPEIGVRADLAGAVVSTTQIGYAIGLFLLVSLADLVENKRLVMLALGGTKLALIGAAVSTTAALL